MLNWMHPFMTPLSIFSSVTKAIDCIHYCMVVRCSNGWTNHPYKTSWWMAGEKRCRSARGILTDEMSYSSAQHNQTVSLQWSKSSCRPGVGQQWREGWSHHFHCQYSYNRGKVSGATLVLMLLSGRVTAASQSATRITSWISCTVFYWGLDKLTLCTKTDPRIDLFHEDG